jgi:L-ascorbate metabolism protein UlaG (beta-lactamase superfamily)
MSRPERGETRSLMNKFWIVSLVALAQLAGCRMSREPLEVTYIGNEGFLISMGNTKVAIDALSDSKYYVSPSDSFVVRMMEDVAPLNDVDYLLVTHDHADHFNAGMVSRYLARHPAVLFIASPQTCGKLVAADSLAGRHIVPLDMERGEQRTVRGGKALVRVLRLDHGSSRETNNLAFLVTANGRTFLHVGDARLVENAEFLQAIDWDAYSIDLLFLEFFDRGSDVQALIDTLIRPKQVILMHIPGGEEEAVRNSDEKVRPGAVVFGREGETRRFDSL